MCNFIQKLGGVLVLLVLSGVVYAAQQENFVEDFSVLLENSGTEQGAASSSATIVAQSEEDEVSSEAIDELDNAEDEIEYTEDDGLVDHYSLPRSAAPVAVDATLQSGSPIGQNTQAALSRPRGVKEDSNTGFFPSLTIGISTHSNPRKESGEPATNQSDFVISIIPELAYRGAINNRHPYELSVSTAVDSFDDFSNLDSTSRLYRAAVNLDISEIIQADLYASRAESNDPRGATATRILEPTSENDEYERNTYGGRLTIGRRSNTFQLSLDAEKRDIDFTNNNQDHRDREDATVGIGLYWNVGPRTSLFIRSQVTDIDYLAPIQNGFDSEETKNTIGLGWDPTYNTSFLFEIGKLEKDLSDPTFVDFDDTTYTAKLNWAISSNTTFAVYGSRTTEETTEFQAPFIDSELVGFNLAHSFTDRFRGDLFYNLIEDDLVGVRQDEITDFGIGAFYSAFRWLTVGVNWKESERTSTDPAAEYKFDSLGITLDFHASRKYKFGRAHTSDDVGQGVSE